MSKRIDRWNVDAFVEEVHREHRHSRACEARSANAARRSTSGVSDQIAVAGNTSLPEHSGHEARMLDANAKAERAHAREIIYAILKFLDDEPRRASLPVRRFVRPSTSYPRPRRQGISRRSRPSWIP